MARPLTDQILPGMALCTLSACMFKAKVLIYTHVEPGSLTTPGLAANSAATTLATQCALPLTMVLALSV
eukprot:2487907-Amphidinium_carterae.2